MQAQLQVTLDQMLEGHDLTKLYETLNGHLKPACFFLTQLVNGTQERVGSNFSEFLFLDEQSLCIKVTKRKAPACCNINSSNTGYKCKSQLQYKTIKILL